MEEDQSEEIEWRSWTGNHDIKAGIICNAPTDLTTALDFAGILPGHAIELQVQAPIRNR